MGNNILLSVGALVVFGTFLSASNRVMTGNTQIAEQNEYYLSAISLAQSLIAEAKTKAFDEKTVTKGVSIPDSLSSTLGPDGAPEVIANPDTLITSAPYTAANPGFRSQVKFDDVDDYNGYSRKVNTQRAEGYTVSSKVQYASVTYPDSIKGSQTFCKRMTVTVKSPFMSDSLTIAYAFTF